MTSNFKSPGIEEYDRYFMTNREMVDRYLGGKVWTMGYNPLFPGNGVYAAGTSGSSLSPNNTFYGNLNRSWRVIDNNGKHTYNGPQFHAIATDGTLWSWGLNQYGQIGNSSSIASSSPIQVGAGTDWKSVSNGAYHVAATKHDGTIWCWGYNGYGQLGQSNITDKSSPVQEMTMSNMWVKAKAGGYTTYGLKTNGTLFAWGWNVYGQLGDNSVTPRSSPIQVGYSDKWTTRFTGGPYSILAIQSDGSLWAWGLNYSGQLGLGDATPRSTPVQVGSATNWRYVEAGVYSTFAIKNDGTLWATGSNSYGDLGLGDTSDRVTFTQVGSDTNWKSAIMGVSYSSSLLRQAVGAVKTDGTIWSWGHNYGFGDPSTTAQPARSSPVQVTNSADGWVDFQPGLGGAIGLRVENDLGTSAEAIPSTLYGNKTVGDGYTSELYGAYTTSGGNASWSLNTDVGGNTPDRVDIYNTELNTWWTLVTGTLANIWFPLLPTVYSYTSSYGHAFLHRYAQGTGGPSPAYTINDCPIYVFRSSNSNWTDDMIKRQLGLTSAQVAKVISAERVWYKQTYAGMDNAVYYGFATLPATSYNASSLISAWNARTIDQYYYNSDFGGEWQGHGFTFSPTVSPSSGSYATSYSVSSAGTSAFTMTGATSRDGGGPLNSRSDYTVTLDANSLVFPVLQSDNGFAGGARNGARESLQVQFGYIQKV